MIQGKGGWIEEPDPSSTTRSASPSDGGEPSSFAENEKLVIPGPEPVVGSVTTVDLARKEGYGEEQQDDYDSLV